MKVKGAPLATAAAHPYFCFTFLARDSDNQ